MHDASILLQEVWGAVKPFLADAVQDVVAEKLQKIASNYGAEFNAATGGPDPFLVTVNLGDKTKRVRVKGPGPGGHIMVQADDNSYIGMIRKTQVMPADRERVEIILNQSNAAS